MVISAAVITILASIIITALYWKVSKTHVFLMLFIVPLDLFAILHQMLFYNGPCIPATLMYNHLAPFFYLPGPMLYLYIKSILEDRDQVRLRNSREYLHFIPLFICLIGVIPYLFVPWDQKLAHVSAIIRDPNTFKDSDVNWLIPTWLNSILRPFLLLVYSISAVALLKRYGLGKARLHAPQFQSKLVLRWLYALAAVTGIIAIVYFAMVVLYFRGHDVREIEAKVFAGTVLISGLLLFIPVMLIIFPQLLYGLPRNMIPTAAEVSTDLITPVAPGEAQIPGPESPTSDYGPGAGEDPEPFQQKAKEILAYIEEHELFIDPDFNIDMIVTEMRIPRNHVYYCFSHVINEKFTSLRARLRVEYAKKLLLGEEARTLSMEGIASRSGFTSRSRFFAIFKEVTGMTPKEYIDHNQ